MKKILTVLLIAVMSLVLVSCGNAQNLDKDVVVVFYTNRGTEIQTIVNPTLGETIARPVDPEKNGYEFVNWYKDLAGTQLWNFDVDTITKSTTIYAKYDLIEYKLIYHVEDGEDIGSNRLSYTVEDDVFFRNSVKKGYTFNGWYKDADFKEKIDRITKGTTGDIEIYSKLAFKISFDTLYLAVDRTILVDPNTVIVKNYANNAILNPTRNGYQFGGWYNIDTTNYVADQILPPEENLIDFTDLVIANEFKVYAYWIKN